MSAGELKFDTRLDTSGFKEGANTLGGLVKGLGVFAALKKGFDMVSVSIDGAVSRYDALNKFPKVMEQMGYGAENAEASINKLSDGIQGLPTTLDDIVTSTKQLTIATGDLDKGTDSALALNNAFIASGAASGDASRGMIQYTQMLSSGKVDMQSWRTLNETMTYALQETAENFGFAGATAKNDLYSALQSGDVTFTAFNDKIIELNNGVGGFAEVAKTASGGINTAWQNMKTAIVRGTEGIVSSIDEGLSQTRFKSIESVITNFGKGFEKTLKGVATVAGFTAKNIVPLSAGVVAFGVAVKGVQLLSMIGQMGSVTAAIKAMTPAIVASTVAKAKETAATLQLNALYIKDAIAKAASAAATTAGTAATAANIAATTLNTTATGGGTLAVIGYTIASAAATAATWLWNAALAANPIVLIIAAVAALVLGVVALASALSNSNAALKEQNEAVKALDEQQKNLTASTEESAKAYSNSVAEIEANAKAGQKLLGTLKGMVDGNGKLTAEQKKAQGVIDDLNSAYEGLNLSYSDEKKLLSANVKEVEKYLAAKDTLAKTTVLEERRVEIARQQAEAEAALAEIAERRAAVDADGTVSYTDKLRLRTQLTEAAKAYDETLSQLATDEEINDSAIAASNSAMAQVVVNSFEAINGAKTTDGKNLKQLAHQYGMSTEEILAQMAAQGVSLQGWSDKNAENFTKDGANIEQVATKWGITTDEVKGYMNEWGMSLEEFNGEMEATHTSAGLSLDRLATKWGLTTAEVQAQMAAQGISMQEWSDNQDTATQDVINSFSEIPKAYDKTAAELTTILNNNAERYSTWTNNLASLTGKMSVEAIAELQKLGPEANSAIEEMIADPAKAAEFEASIVAVMEAGADGAKGAAPEFAEAGEQVGESISKGVEESSQEVETATTKMMNSAVAAASEVVNGANVISVGQNLSAGVAKGIIDGGGLVVAASKQVIQLALAAMQAEAVIKSPSRKFRNEIGRMVSKGFALGIQDGVPEAESEARKLADSVYQAATNAIGEHKYFGKLSLKEELATYRVMAKKFAEYADIRKKINKEIYRIENELRKDNFSKEKQAIEDKVKYNDISLLEQLKSWEKVQKKYRKGTEERKTAEEEIWRLKQEIAKETFTKEKQAIADQIKYSDISLREQLKSWEKLQAKYKEGTEERKVAEEEIWRLKKEISEKAAALEAKYQEAVKTRAQEIFNTYSLFEKVLRPKAVSGKKLISNLESQVDATKKWATDIAELQKKGINKGLLEELQKMGPSASGEIAALLRLTDSELQKYSNLYGEKQRLANEQATKELKDLRVQTDKELKGLLEDAAVIVEKPALEVGKIIGASIADGLDLTLPSIIKRVEAISREISRVAGKKLDMTSLFSGVSGFGGELKGPIESAAAALNSKMRTAIGANQLAFAGAASISPASQQPASSTVNNYFNQTINSPKHTSPAENSREAQAMMRRATWQIP